MPVHPCGQVVDFLRFGYKTRARLWQNDATTVEIRWFRAEPGAQLVPQPNPYVSGMWDVQKGETAAPLGDVHGAPRKWDNGANPVGYLGTNHCGDALAWRFGGVHGRDAEIVTDKDGDSTCCDRLTLAPHGGIAVGGLATFLPLIRPYFPFAGGKRVGGSFVERIAFRRGKVVGGAFVNRLAFRRGKVVGGSFETGRPMTDGKVVGGPLVSPHPIPVGYTGDGGFKYSVHLQKVMDGGKKVGGAFELGAATAGGKVVGGEFPHRPVFTGGKVVGGAFLVSVEFARGKKVGGAFTVEDADVIPPGIIAPFGGSTVPSGWLECDGSTFSSVTYPALATALGDTWGTHSGTTYYLPDLRGRLPIGAGSGSGLSTRTLGTSGGNETHTQIGAEVGQHTHNQNAPSSTTGGSELGVILTYNTGSGQVDTFVPTSYNAAPSAMDIMNPWSCTKFIVKT